MQHDGIVVTPDVVVVDVAGTAVTWVPRRRELLELSDDAARLVGAVAAGDPDAVPTTDVSSLLDQLLDLGVLVEDAPPAAEGRDDDPAVPEGPVDGDEPTTGHGHEPGSIVLGPFAALDWCFTITLDDPVLAAEVDRVLAGLATGRPPLGSYTIPGNDGGLELLRDGRHLDAGTGRAHVLATLLWDVNRQAVAATTDHLVLHAGAVVVDGRAVVLPAAMEAGKTTLVTGLVRAGHDYLSDELATVPDPVEDDPPRVLPFAKAISLDPGSWPLFPDLEPGADRRALSPNQWLLPAEHVRASATTSEPTVLGAIVLPRHRSGSATTITRLDPAEALRALVECAFDFLERPRHVLPRLARLAESVSVHRMVVGDGVDDAVSLVETAVATWGRAVDVAGQAT